MKPPLSIATSLALLVSEAGAQSLLFQFPNDLVTTNTPRAQFIEPLGDVDGDGIDDFARSEPNNGGGVVIVRSGVDGSEIHRIVGGFVGGSPRNTGWLLATVDDLDGVRELVVSSPNGGTTSPGARISVHDGATGAMRSEWRCRSFINERVLGLRMGNIGDFDGYGFDDIGTWSRANGYTEARLATFSPALGARITDVVEPDPGGSFIAWHKNPIGLGDGDGDGDGRDDFATGPAYTTIASKI